MSINIQYAPDPRIVGEAAYQTGYGKAAAENAKLRAQMSAQLAASSASKRPSRKELDEASARRIAEKQAEYGFRGDLQSDKYGFQGDLQNQKLGVTEGGKNFRQGQGIDAANARYGLNPDGSVISHAQLIREQVQAQLQRQMQAQVAKQQEVAQKQDEDQAIKIIESGESTLENRKTLRDFMDQYRGIISDPDYADPDFRANELQELAKRRSEFLATVKKPPTGDERAAQFIDDTLQKNPGWQQGPGNSVIDHNGTTHFFKWDDKARQMVQSASHDPNKFSEQGKAHEVADNYRKQLDHYDQVYSPNYEQHFDNTVIKLATMMKADAEGNKVPMYTDPKAEALKLLGPKHPPPPPPNTQGQAGGLHPAKAQRAFHAMQAARALGMRDPRQLAEVGRRAGEGQ